jgi:hypothetical protein
MALLAAARCTTILRRENGQASILIIGVLVAILVGVFLLGGVARGIGSKGDLQRAADLAALAGAKAMHSQYFRLFESGGLDGKMSELGLEKSKYLKIGRAKAEAVGKANGGERLEITFPDESSFAPRKIRVRAKRRFNVNRVNSLTLSADAVAELGEPMVDGISALAGGGGYDGPLAYRQGKPMRPDVAVAFDRMAEAARSAGHNLIVVSGFRSDAEQAVIWRRNPNPKWVAPPGKSLHRMGTELDLGPPSAYRWLFTNSKRFHFIRRYPWEAWHFGYILNARSTPRGPQYRSAVNSSLGGGMSRSQISGSAVSVRRGIPAFVPDRYRMIIMKASQRWSVSALLLSAQLKAESDFNPNLVSSRGAQGIAQFMPGTARGFGLKDSFDPNQAIDAQARLMRNHLRRFGSVSLALAAYNAGPGAVARYGGIPPYAETRGYVRKIFALMNGGGEIAATDADSGLVVRLVA